MLPTGRRAHHGKTSRWPGGICTAAAATPNGEAGVAGSRQACQSRPRPGVTVVVEVDGRSTVAGAPLLPEPTANSEWRPRPRGSGGALVAHRAVGLEPTGCTPGDAFARRAHTACHVEGVCGTKAGGVVSVAGTARIMRRRPSLRVGQRRGQLGARDNGAGGGWLDGLTA